ncbi:MAG: hypothetical protein JWR35_2175 [Marmoricola sp.]|nr:hypothetical protein [Marmoricola sp.]
MNGDPLPPADVARIRQLAIPPAWTDVWICPYERGHLQAVGTDDAGRRQYLYHPAWREQRDADKHLRVELMARRLPSVRARLRDRLAHPDTSRESVLALGVRLIDLGCFRVGSDEYAETNGSYGLTTMELRHLSRRGQEIVFRFDAKSSIEQEIAVADRDVIAAVGLLTRRRDKGARLLAWRDGRVWVDATANDLNEHLNELFGADVTAKDFRTWQGTVIVAESLASVERAGSPTGRRRQVRAAIADAAEVLGNTPTVAEKAYVDRRVIDLFEDGHTIKPPAPSLTDPDQRRDRLDRAVSRLLR